MEGRITVLKDVQDLISGTMNTLLYMAKGNQGKDKNKIANHLISDYCELSEWARYNQKGP